MQQKCEEHFLEQKYLNAGVPAGLVLIRLLLGKVKLPPGRVPTLTNLCRENQVLLFLCKGALMMTF